MPLIYASGQFLVCYDCLFGCRAADMLACIRTIYKVCLPVLLHWDLT
jgi:hypothetical protein